MLKANISELQAKVKFQQIQFQRQQTLFLKKFAAEEVRNFTQTDLVSKTQQLTAKQAELARGEWTLQQKTIYAPVSGEVFDTFYRVGERVQENHPVLAILSPKNIKVLFYVPEKRLSEIKLGKKVLFTCDSCKKSIAARISYISPEAEYTPPVIYSKDTRDKLVFLIRADMPEDVARHFHPGQPITVDFPHE
jgi:HlyD family secretion protein